jgi:hypothetical protein
MQFPRHQRGIERGWPTEKTGRPKKITPAMSSSIEILSCLDSSLTNREILMMARSHSPTIALSESSVSAGRIRLGFTWRSPLVKQDLTIAEEHQRFQFANDLMAMAINPTKIIFSDEYRFVLGDDHHWRHLRRGEWNDTMHLIAFLSNSELFKGPKSRSHL